MLARVLLASGRNAIECSDDPIIRRGKPISIFSRVFVNQNLNVGRNDVNGAIK